MGSEGPQRTVGQAADKEVDHGFSDGRPQAKGLHVDGNRIGSDPVGDHAKVVRSCRQSAGNGEVGRLCGNTGGYSHGAVVGGAAVPDLSAFFQAHDGIVGGIGAVVAVAASLRETVELAPTQDIGAANPHGGRNVGDFRFPGRVGGAIRRIDLDVAASVGVQD